MKNSLHKITLVAIFMFGLSPAIGLAQSRPDILWMRGGHSETVQTTIFSTDGSMIATSDGQNAKIMRASDGVLLMSIPFGTNSLAFSPDSQTIAALVPPNAP